MSNRLLSKKLNKSANYITVYKVHNPEVADFEKHITARRYEQARVKKLYCEMLELIREKRLSNAFGKFLIDKNYLKSSNSVHSWSYYAFKVYTSNLISLDIIEEYRKRLAFFEEFRLKKSFRGYLRDLKDLAVEYEKRIFRADKLEDKLNRACSLLTEELQTFKPGEMSDEDLRRFRFLRSLRDMIDPDKLN